MSEADTPSAALIATITQHRAGWGTDCGIALAPLDAKRSGSKGYGGCMADARSAIPAAGMARQGPPDLADPGAHPFWPGDRAMHGTGLAATPGKNIHPTCSFRMPELETIIVHHRSLPGTRTAHRGCEWRAECLHGGKTWVETSRSGASHALARTLKNSGVQDAQFEIHENGRVGYLLVPSFHAWAEWTYSGDRRVRWDAQQASLEQLRALRE